MYLGYLTILLLKAWITINNDLQFLHCLDNHRLLVSGTPRRNHANLISYACSFSFSCDNISISRFCQDWKKNLYASLSLYVLPVSVAAFYRGNWCIISQFPSYIFFSFVCSLLFQRTGLQVFNFEIIWAFNPSISNSFSPFLRKWEYMFCLLGGFIYYLVTLFSFQNTQSVLQFIIFIHLTISLLWQDKWLHISQRLG